MTPNASKTPTIPESYFAALGITGIRSLSFVGEGSTGAALCSSALPCIVIAGTVGEVWYFTMAPDAARHQQDLARGATFAWDHIQQGLNACATTLEQVFREPSPTAVYFDVNAHAYGRAGHGQDEMDVRMRVAQIFEWWYDPTSYARIGHHVFAGLAGNGPTATIYYNQTRNVVNDLIYQPTITDARAYVNKREYTQLVAFIPIP